MGIVHRWGQWKEIPSLLAASGGKLHDEETSAPHLLSTSHEGVSPMVQTWPPMNSFCVIYFAPPGQEIEGFEVWCWALTYGGDIFKEMPEKISRRYLSYCWNDIIVVIQTGTTRFGIIRQSVGKTKQHGGNEPRDGRWPQLQIAWKWTKTERNILSSSGSVESKAVPILMDASWWFSGTVMI